MGRIVVAASIENGLDPSFRIQSDALVDTSAAYLTLPAAWRGRLGELKHLDTVLVETATQAVVSGDICGPVLLRMGQFRPVLTEALFIEMELAQGRYEPLIGYIPLEQAQAVVDLVGHRLAKFGRVDLKAATKQRQFARHAQRRSASRAHQRQPSTAASARTSTIAIATRAARSDSGAATKR